jgi:hypothetical protein
MAKYTLLLVLILATKLSFAQTSSDTLTNAKVIKMVKSGLSEALIVKSIQAAPACNFKLSSDDLILLKQNKVPDKVVLEMFERKPAPPSPVQPKANNNNTVTKEKEPEANNTSKEADLKLLSPGIYYEQTRKGKTEYKILNAIATAKDATNASSNDLMIAGKFSQTEINERQPVFYFITGKANNTTFDPAKFIVVQADARKGNRFLVPYKADDKSTALTQPLSTKISNNIYKITFDKKLSNGSYFFAPLQLNATGQQLFEFDIWR